jgi:hypothetical protein
MVPWMLIFIHNIIPHHHPIEDETGCYELIHRSSCDVLNNDVTQSCRCPDEQVKVCHISGLLFHQFSQDIQIISDNRDFHSIFTCPSGKAFFHENQYFISDHLYGSSSLRAPPSA